MVVSTRTWKLGPGGSRGSDMEAGPKDTARDQDKLDLKLLAKSQASLAESERMLSRQAIVLAKLRADGLATAEAEKSMARLEAALLAQRSAHDGLVMKAGAKNEGERMSAR